MPERLKVVYIGGFGRSGSTLLSRLLGEAPGVVPAGELFELWKRGYIENQLCGCGEPFLSCEFWRKVSEEAFQMPAEDVPAQELEAERLRVHGRPAIPRLWVRTFRTAAYEVLLEDYLGVLERVYASVASVAGAHTVVDSSKVPQYAWLLSRAPTIDLHVVHLVRDSRGTAYSWRRRKLRPEIHWQLQEMDRQSSLRSSLEWDLFNFMLDARRSTFASYLVVRYEDLISDPNGCLAEISAAVGEDMAPPADLSGPIELSMSHTASGNPSRFDIGSTRLTRDDEWMDQMQPLERMLVTAVTAPGLRAYQYPVKRNKGRSSMTKSFGRPR